LFLGFANLIGFPCFFDQTYPTWEAHTAVLSR